MEVLIVCTKVLMALLTGIACGSVLHFMTNISMKHLNRIVPAIAFFGLMICFYRLNQLGIVFFKEIASITWYDITISTMVTLAWFLTAMHIDMKELSLNEVAE